jgi:creatinine amidohydrolase
MTKSFISDMSWEEFRDSVDPTAVLVIPMGSTELEGSHLPLGVDTIVADGIAARLAGEPGVLIGPSLPVGYSKWFNPFPGTISLEHETLTRLLHDYCTGLIRHGVKRLIFLNSHRGNTSAIETTVHRLIASHSVRFGMLSVWKLANELISGSDLIAEGKFTHAGEIMTSILLTLRPDTVVLHKIRPDQVKSPPGTDFSVKNSLGETVFKGSTQFIYQDIRELTDTGIMGDPTGASKAKGERLLDLMTGYIKDFLQEFRKIPLDPAGRPYDFSNPDEACRS